MPDDPFGGWNAWGYSPPPPSPLRHPSSRGAFLGLNYRAMPEMTAPIEDQRGNIPETPPPLQGEAAENASILSRYPPGSHVYTKEAWDWLQSHMPGDLPTTPIEDPGFDGWTDAGPRQGFADGGDIDPLDGWTAEPVDHDPFALPTPYQRPSNAVLDLSGQGSDGAIKSANSADLIAPSLPGSPYRPTPPPSRGLVKDFFPVDTPDEPQVYGGQWGQGAEHAYQNLAGSFGSVVDWLGNKVEEGVGGAAAAAGVPGAAGLGRDIRGIIETGEGVGGVKRPEPVPRRVSPLGFYSHGADTAANLPQKVGTTQQMVAQLKQQGVKPVEMQASGVSKLAETAPTLFPEKIDKGTLEDMFHQASPQLQETVHGRPDFDAYRDKQDEFARQIREAEDASDFTEADRLDAEMRAHGEAFRNTPEAKFGDWVLPGPYDNYREVLLHTPEQPKTFAAHLDDNKIGPDFPSAQEARDWARIQGPNIRPGSRPGITVRETTPPDQPPPFTDSHWDTPNVVAHLRFSDRMGVPADETAPADKHLHLEELQSDWGQKGRDEGFTRPLTPDEQELQSMYQREADERPTYDWHRALELENAGVGQSLKEATAGKHPLGPYVTNTNDWTDLGLKRALIEAARGDYTHLSWATGTAQADRYKLSRHVSDLSYNPETGSLQGRAVGGGRAIDERNVGPPELANYVGPEVAQRMLETPKGPHFSAVDEPHPRTAAWQRSGWHTLSGEDLNIGGQGMRSYYDPAVVDNEGKPMLNKDGSPKVGVLPTQLSKIVKKLDPSVKIGSSQIQGKFPGRYRTRVTPNGDYRVEDMNGNRISEHMTGSAADAKIRQLTQNKVHSIPITPLMREKILKGLPQYQRGGRVGFADGGAPEDDPLAGSVTYAHPQLEPVDYDPFPPPPKVEPSDIARAKGFPEPRSPMHDRIQALSQDEGAVDPSIAAHAAAAAPESWAHYAGNPEHPMWRRIGAAGVEEARRVGQGLWSAGTLPGDIATGKTTMEDPEAQQRAMDLAGAVTLAPVGEVPEGALTAGMRRRAPRRPTGELPEVTSTYEPPGWEAKAAELKPPPPPPAELKTTDTEKLSMIGHNKGPSIEQPLVNQALPSFEHPDFPEGRIATSVPTSVSRADAAHSNNSLQIGMDLARENPETYRKNADVIRNYDWLRLPENATDDQAHEALINHVKNNLVALHDAINPDYRPGSSQWYDGANQIVNGMASEYGRRPENAAGLVAALSPQRDWFMNVENARRVADVLHHQKDMPVSAAMEQWARNYANSRNPTGRVTPDIVNGMIDGMIGKPLSEMTPEQKAFYVRMYDAAHGPHPSRLPVDAEGNPHPEGYYILNPDGSSTGRVARTNSGAVKRLTWGSGGQLANAIRAFEAEDMPTISRAMGNRHKVRNFYNNNVSPNSASGATTIDTHAIAGGLLQPLGASAPEVEHGLGMKGSKFNGNGSSGLYPNYFEGYRRAAQEISKRPGGQTILPRQLQSITWEGIRGLFSPAQRSSPSFIEGIKNLWRRYASGRLSLRNVLQRIFRNQETGESNIGAPQWVTGDDRVEDEAGE